MGYDRSPKPQWSRFKALLNSAILIHLYAGAPPDSSKGVQDPFGTGKWSRLYRFLRCLRPRLYNTSAISPPVYRSTVNFANLDRIYLFSFSLSLSPSLSLFLSLSLSLSVSLFVFLLPRRRIFRRVWNVSKGRLFSQQ